MKTALITGIGRGIGRALAQKFLNEGFFVIGTSMTGTVDFEHENLSVCQLDLSSPASIEECVKTAHGLDKKIDILINNAGVLLDKEETVLVDLDKIAAGEEPDFFIKPNDLVNVGTHPTSRWRAVLRNAFRATYGFGFLYDRNFADRDYGTSRPLPNWF